MKDDMKKRCKAVLAAMLFFATSVLSSCSGSGSDTVETVLPGIPKEIKEDTLWYSSERLEIDLSGEGDSVTLNPVYADDSEIYLYADIFSMVPAEDIDDPAGGYRRSGELIRYSRSDRSIDWKLELSAQSEVFFYNGKMIAMTSVQDPDTYQDKRSFYQIDTEKGTLGGELTDLKIKTYLDSLPGGSMIDGKIPFDDGVAFCVSKNNMDGTYTPVIYYLDNEGNVSTKDLSVKCSEMGIKNSFTFYKLDGEHIAVKGQDWDFLNYDDSFSIKGFSYDVVNGTFKDLDPSSPLLKEDYGRHDWSYCGSSLLSSDSYGISEYDVSRDKAERTLDFNNTNIDRAEFDQVMAPIYANGGLFIVGGYGHHGSDGVYVIYVFSKEEKNPNAGKSVITVADTSERISDQMSRAVFEFNDQSDDAFIVMDDRYCLLNYLDDEEKNEYEMIGNSTSYFQDEARFKRMMSGRMTTSLRMDILSGKGPDVILNSSAYTELDNGEVFMDLTDRLSDLEYDLYDNVIEYCKTDGVLYQLPLSFRLSGITLENNDGFNSTYENPAGDGKYGITFDEYRELVKNRLDGMDYFRYYYSREELFMLLFRWYEKDMIKDGVFDAGCEEFRKIAEYVMEYADEKPYLESLSEMGDDEQRERFFFECNLLAGNMFTFPGECISGLPSLDGRGPMAFPVVSAAITTDCSDPDAAWEFISYLLSEEGQGYLCNYDIMINRKAEEKAAYDETAILMTWMYDVDWSSYPPEVQRPELSSRPTEEEILAKTEENLDMTNGTIENISGVLKGNTDIETIVREEIGAYFAGDRTLDEIIPIINNRVNTVLEERR